MKQQPVCGDEQTDAPFKKLMSWLRSVTSEDGAGLAEYSLLLLLVAVAAISVFTSLAGAIQTAVSTWVSAYNGIN